jgi:hypothetical protein
MATSMLGPLVFVTMAAPIIMHTANAACGSTLLQQNFDQYQGSYQPISKDVAKVAFSAGNQASLRSGYNTGPGLVFLKQASQGAIGAGHLKSVLPAGALVGRGSLSLVQLVLVRRGQCNTHAFFCLGRDVLSQHMLLRIYIVHACTFWTQYSLTIKIK